MSKKFKTIEELRNDNFFSMGEIEQTEYLRVNGFFKLETADKISFLENLGLFYLDINEDPPTIPLNPDKVDYLRKKLSSRIKSKAVTKYAEYVVKKLIKNNQLIIKDVEGIENMQKVKTGAVLTCNHFNPFDCLIMELMFRKSGQNKHKKIYKIIREGNYTNFPGLYGLFFRNCDTLPLGTTKKAISYLINAVDEVLKRGNFILIYPEQSMWLNYKLPKPLKNGSFNFAVKNNVPVIPSFITFEDSDVIGDDGNTIQAYTIHIGEPIYIDENLSAKENMKMMREKNFKFWKNTYEKVYRNKLKYSTIEYDEIPKFVVDTIKFVKDS